MTTKSEEELVKEKMRKRAFINEKLNGGDSVESSARKSKWYLKNHINFFKKIINLLKNDERRKKNILGALKIR